MAPTFKFALGAALSISCPWDPDSRLPATITGRRIEDRGDGDGERISYFVSYQALDGQGTGRYFEEDVEAA